MYFLEIFTREFSRRELGKSGIVMNGCCCKQFPRMGVACSIFATCIGKTCDTTKATKHARSAKQPRTDVHRDEQANAQHRVLRNATKAAFFVSILSRLFFRCWKASHRRQWLPLVSLMYRAFHSSRSFQYLHSLFEYRQVWQEQNYRN